MSPLALVMLLVSLSCPTQLQVEAHDGDVGANVDVGDGGDGGDDGDDVAERSAILHSALQEALLKVNGAYSYSRDRVKRRLGSGAATPADLMTFFKQPAAATREAARAAEVRVEALSLLRGRLGRHKRDLNSTDFLSADELAVVSRITGCAAQTLPLRCQSGCFADRYPGIGGLCNNLANPRLGAANTGFVRWLPPAYEDGLGKPRGWSQAVNGFSLPSVRLVSNSLVREVHGLDDDSVSHMFVQWGQWLAHDVDLTPQSPSLLAFSSGRDCDASCQQVEPCFPIKIPADDPRINSSTNPCMPFVRSSPVCGTGDQASALGIAPPVGEGGGGPPAREQFNALSAFVDAGQVYGSDVATAAGLRASGGGGGGGELRINANFTDGGLSYLPTMVGAPGAACTVKGSVPPGLEVPCFLAGEVRANEQDALQTLHIVFLREHNRVARELRGLNPHWGGDTVYWEARRILIAYMQVITWRDYIPRVLGPAFAPPPYRGYDSTVDPRVANVVATAALRFGHATVPALVRRLNESYQEHPLYPSLPLHMAFFTPWRIVHEGGAEPMLRGLLGSPASLAVLDALMSDELREKLFALSRKVALDLASLNLQRGRDHGLPGYPAWRSHCGLSAPSSETELAAAWAGGAVAAARALALYGSPANVDVWLGGLLEAPVAGGRVGPLFACLLGKQFTATRDGDRFWFERDGLFSAAQLAQLRGASLSRIICDNTRIDSVPAEAFLYQPYPAGFVSCSSLPSVKLQAWQEDTRNTPCGAIPSVPNAYSVMCGTAATLAVRYQCRAGFTMNGPTDVECVGTAWGAAPTCLEVDLCTVSPSPCASIPNSVCEGGSGGGGPPRCVCLPGFQSSSNGDKCTVTPVDPAPRNLLVATVIISALALAAIVAVGLAICMCLHRVQKSSVLAGESAIHTNKYATT